MNLPEYRKQTHEALRLFAENLEEQFAKLEHQLEIIDKQFFEEKEADHVVSGSPEQGY